MFLNTCFKEIEEFIRNIDKIRYLYSLSIAVGGLVVILWTAVHGLQAVDTQQLSSHYTNFLIFSRFIMLQFVFSAH